jgi:hypothetical protein
MASLGLTTIQKTLDALQAEIMNLRGGSSRSTPDGILNIRTKFLEEKIDKLNDEFIKSVTDEMPLVKLVIITMEFVESYGVKYAEYLSCSNSGAFKLELCLNLLSKIGEYDYDLVRDIINSICSASKQILLINSKKPNISIIDSEPERAENQLVVRKPTNGKLRKFLYRSKN